MILLPLFLALSAHAFEAPPPGDFPRETLYGMYQFESCSNGGAAIWEGEHARQYVIVSHDPFDTRAMPEGYMAAALFHTSYNPLVPIWEFSDLGKGRVEIPDESTGKMRQAHESYTTTSGVYTRMEWNFGEDNGWATMWLFRADETHLAYEMESQYNQSGNHRTESCRLVKVAE